jgi:hypothetical protein
MAGAPLRLFPEFPLQWANPFVHHRATGSFIVGSLQTIPCAEYPSALNATTPVDKKLRLSPLGENGFPDVLQSGGSNP